MIKLLKSRISIKRQSFLFVIELTDGRDSQHIHYSVSHRFESYDTNSQDSPSTYQNVTLQELVEIHTAHTTHVTFDPHTCCPNKGIVRPHDVIQSPHHTALLSREISSSLTPASFYHACTEDLHHTELDILAREPLFPIDELVIFDLYMVGKRILATWEAKQSCILSCC